MHTNAHNLRTALVTIYSISTFFYKYVFRSAEKKTILESFPDFEDSLLMFPKTFLAFSNERVCLQYKRSAAVHSRACLPYHVTHLVVT